VQECCSALRSQQNDTGTSIKEEVVHVASKEVATPHQDSGHEAANVESLTTNVDMMEIDG
jgi:hypothetical protein